MPPITSRQLDAVRAHVGAGGVKGAAHRLGVSPRTVSVHLANARHRADVETTTQLVYLLTASGALRVDDWRGE